MDVREIWFYIVAIGWLVVWILARHYVVKRVHQERLSSRWAIVILGLAATAFMPLLMITGFAPLIPLLILIWALAGFAGAALGVWLFLPKPKRSKSARPDNEDR
jgi:hypothetical protein